MREYYSQPQKVKTNRFKICLPWGKEKEVVAACHPISTNNPVEKKSLEMEIKEALTCLKFYTITLIMDKYLINR